MNKQSLGLLGFWILVSGCFLAGSVVACPASYVKRKGEESRGTQIHDKATKVADRYMEEKGFDVTSSQADIIRPYVVGTTLVDHSWAKRNRRNRYAHSLDKPIAECVLDSLKCRHHAQHFGDARRKFGLGSGVVVPASQNLGG